MQSSDHPIYNYFNKGNLNRNIYVFLICIGISSIIWLFIAFSKESQTTITTQIKIFNIPDSLDVYHISDTAIQLAISGSPSLLFQLKYLKKDELILIDLDKYQIQNGENRYSFSIATLQLLQSYLKKYKNRIEILSVYPSNIIIDLAKINSKKVIITPNLNLNFKPQFDLSEDLIILPDSITLSGNDEILRNIQSLNTKEVSLNDIEKSGDITLELINPNPQSIVLSDQTITIKYVVDRFTESKISLQLENNTGVEDLKTFPNTVKVTYMVSLKDFNKINSEMFYISPEKPDLTDGRKKLKVNILHQPDFIKVKSIQPDSVNYILIK